MKLLKPFFCSMTAMLFGQMIIAQYLIQNKHKVQGTLRVHPVNSRYFTDQSGDAIYLTGSHTWPSVMDMTGPSGKQTPEDNSFLDWISGYGHNFTRLWVTEGDGWIFHDIYPHPFERTGPGLAADGKPKYDLTKLNEAYFDRLKSRVQAAYDRGIYVSIFLFGHAGGLKNNTPYRIDNNINNINGDPDGDGYAIESRRLQIPSITNVQEAYVKKLIETVNGFDNVLYEIACESDLTTTAWQYHFINFIRQCESKLPKQHLIGMSSDGGYGPGDDTKRLFESPADWVGPGWDSDTTSSYMKSPSAKTHGKIVLLDTDHLWGVGGDSKWVWKTFTRGLHPSFMDPYTEMDPGATLRVRQSQFDSARFAMGLTLKVANQIDLASMVPHNEFSSTQYCLANPGYAYLVYLPDGGKATIDLSNANGELNVQWLNPRDGTVVSTKKIKGGQQQEFQAPFDGDAVLYLSKRKQEAFHISKINTNKLHLHWKDNILTISGKDLPGGKMDILYIEAFCKTGSTNREWNETTIPHKTTALLEEDNHIQLKSTVHPNVEVIHDILSHKDAVEFNLTLHNKGDKTIDLDWFQPCIRVDQFTNRKQENYIDKCFIFTKQGLTTLDKTRRTEEGFYKGGQTYVPAGINLKDVNPRPISPDQPSKGLIGCFSGDNKYIMATAWDHYQELFQGIFVCIHSDPRVGGLKPGEVKKLRGKIYYVKNNLVKLLRRYHHDFPAQ
jgi:hypothetical protein